MAEHRPCSFSPSFLSNPGAAQFLAQELEPPDSVLRLPTGDQEGVRTPKVIDSDKLSQGELTENRDTFPSDEALTKLFCLALRNISQMWTLPIRDGKAALRGFTIEFRNRLCVN